MKSFIKKIGNWIFPYWKNILTIVGVLLALAQFEKSNKIESAHLMIDFNNQLRNENHIYPKIISAIGNNKPLLRSNGGEFTEDDIDNYLVMWELLDNTYEEHLINEDMLYDAFSYDIEKAYCNAEIKSYITKVRKEGEGLYVGFEDLAKHLLKSDRTKCK